MRIDCISAFELELDSRKTEVLAVKKLGTVK